MGAKAFTGHIKLLIQIKHLITTQIMLVEAAKMPHPMFRWQPNTWSLAMESSP